jgi:hypothetical protein
VSTRATAIHDGPRSLVAGDEGYDEARRAWNLAADHRPDAVVLAESDDQIAFAGQPAISRPAG